MKKTLLAAVAAIALAPAAFAGEAQPAGNSNFSGFTASGLIGYSSVTEANDDVTNGQKGAIGGIELGYGKVLPNSSFFLGLKVSGLLSGAKGDTAEGIEIKHKNSFNIAARAGMVFGNAMPFIEAGWERSKFEIVEEGEDKVTTNTSGLLLGLGVDVAVNKIIMGVAVNHVSGSKNDFKPKSTRGMFKIGYKF